MSWANEIVEEAWFCKRPLDNPILQYICNHVGVVVKTNKGNKWLIHNACNKERNEFGIYVTDVKNMSNKWKYGPIPVKRKNVTISTCQKVMGLKGHEFQDWVDANVCIGAAIKLKLYLGMEENSSDLEIGFEFFHDLLSSNNYLKRI